MHKRIDDMVWPVPGKTMNELEYALRYSREPRLTRLTRLMAAEVISAYRQMIFEPRRKRDRVIAKLREGEQDAPDSR